ncbi:MAG: UDP-N-acetylmuramoyl-tripeptide--D-alanyl-D-alanine ligase [Bacteroidales bacterium]|nr:UDP-N-acetylmuramoyl-tripeptide--D-alanyl-D-alanine ligase [Bacteroidales bacterium]MDD4209468.1 UDP-N-acetylmuramoyl-tripeptide--D-alanyl-D-alanine ligase [Bacteroidales bacterium]
MLSIPDIYNLYLTYPIICTDTRNITENCIFFCLKGENFNGNTFAHQALKNGASFVIVDEKEYVLNKRCIYVKDALETLQTLAHFHRKHLNIPIIGITGSNGKTTTKELINAVLSSQYNVFATHGNLNNHIGVPLSLLSINKDVEIAIIEMGANHPHEIAFLCSIVLPTMGLITNIGKAHLEGFHTIATIIETKIALYKSVKQRNGQLFVNKDDSLLLAYASGSPLITYGKHTDADSQGELLSDDLVCNILLPTSNTIISTQLIGDYNFYNIMAAIAVGSYFNVTLTNIQTSLANYKPTNSRSQILYIETNTIILDAYNANPSSMEVALYNFASLKTKNKIVILGDMKELGIASEEEHQHIVNLINKLAFTEVFLVGPEFNKTHSHGMRTFESYEKASAFISQHKPLHSVILIKGSRTMKMERFLEII